MVTAKPDAVCYAIPTSLDLTTIAARDEAPPVLGLYGDSGGPEIDDLLYRTKALRLTPFDTDCNRRLAR
jgi:hypothetical protein